jgi:hypothetical protein
MSSTACVSSEIRIVYTSWTHGFYHFLWCVVLCFCLFVFVPCFVHKVACFCIVDSWLSIRFSLKFIDHNVFNWLIKRIHNLCTLCLHNYLYRCDLLLVARISLMQINIEIRCIWYIDLTIQMLKRVKN